MKTYELRKRQRAWVNLAAKAEKNRDLIPENANAKYMIECAETVISAANTMEIYFERIIADTRHPSGRSKSK